MTDTDEQAVARELQEAVNFTLPAADRLARAAIACIRARDRERAGELVERLEDAVRMTPDTDEQAVILAIRDALLLLGCNPKEPEVKVAAAAAIACIRKLDRERGSEMQSELERVREWAQQKIQGGSEPPWAWYQYMKLRETLDAILAGMAATTTESSPQSAEHPGTPLRLVAGTDQPDTARRAGLPIQPPM